MAKNKQGLGCFSALVMMFLFIWFSFLISKCSSDSVVEETRSANKRYEERMSKEFYAEKNSIIKQIEILKERKEFDAALSVANKYVSAKDPELNKQIDSINELKLYEKVKKVPASDWQKNAKLYLELIKLNPGNAAYKEKYSFYQDKIDQRAKEKAAEKAKRAAEEAKNQKETAEHEAKFGKAPRRSDWDGSVYEVEKYLKSIANDPDSIEIDGCSQIYRVDKGWLVGCKYGGKNIFGGMVRKTNWFIFSHGQVVEMLDASAYNLP